MKKTKLYLILIFLLSANAIQSQVNREWVQTYTRAGTFSDIGGWMGVDLNGSIIVLSHSFTSVSPANHDVDILKFDQSGNLIWNRTFAGANNSGDFIQGLSIDNGNNIIFTGTKDHPGGGSYPAVPYLIKYNTNGDSLWSKTFASTSNHGHSYGCQTDQFNNIYYGGHWGTSTPLVNIRVKKFNPSGSELLGIEWNVPGQREDVLYLKLDAAGNIYITGAYNPPTSSDIFVKKYSPTGSEIWTAYYNGPQNKSDFCWLHCMDIDASGNVYLLGEINNDNHWGIGGNQDVALIKFSSTGSLLWSREFSGSANGMDYPSGLIVDSDNNILFAMNIKDNSSGYDVFFKKYNPNGDSIWSRKYNGPANLDDFAAYYTLPKLDKEGNVYFSGYHKASASTGFDAICWKYSSAGQLVWSQTYNSTSPDSNDHFYGLTIDSSGNVFCTGSRYSLATREDVILVKYVQSPYRPEDLTANAVSQTRINLSWLDRSGNESTFKIERSTNAGMNWLLKDSVPANTTNYSDTALSPNTIYHYRIYARNTAGSSSYSNIAFDTTFSPVVVLQNSNEIPKTFRLFANYPNPFNPVTAIKFDIPEQSFTKLVIYDLLGKEVKTLVDMQLQAGSYTAQLNAEDLASGIYFYRLETGKFTDVKKMILVK